MNTQMQNVITNNAFADIFDIEKTILYLSDHNNRLLYPILRYSIDIISKSFTKYYANEVEDISGYNSESYYFDQLKLINKSMKSACRYNNVELMMFLCCLMRSHYNYNVHILISSACYHNRILLFQYILEDGIHEKYNYEITEYQVNQSTQIETLLIMLESQDLSSTSIDIDVMHQLNQHSKLPLIKILTHYVNALPFYILDYVMQSNAHLSITKYWFDTLLIDKEHINSVFTMAVYLNKIPLMIFLIQKGADSFHELSASQTLKLLNLGIPVQNQFTKFFKLKRKHIQEIVIQHINNLKLTDYDINITNIIKEYISYEKYKSPKEQIETLDEY